MRIDVDFIDLNAKSHSLIVDMSLPAFLKHLAISGQGERGGALMALSRGAGAYLFHRRYFDVRLWRLAGLRRAHPYLHDPTDQGDFSTLAGRAVADFLAKKLLDAKFTHGYEAAMQLKKLPLVGDRPDFYCVTRDSKRQFAMEAKGYGKKYVGSIEMAEHKAQSKSGPLAVHFTVASVLFRCYGKPRCNFHDPLEGDVEFDFELNAALANQFYSGLLEEFDAYLERVNLEIDGREFISYELSSIFPVRRGRRASLLLDARIPGVLNSERVLDFSFEPISSKRIYVDVDGVGFTVM
ncbi:TPA: hypothetical protein QEL15_002447 [Stenotrophomonas maltophilia]|nr:hypothetical protein [Stenotrophomonas maltophilia]